MLSQAPRRLAGPPLILLAVATYSLLGIALRDTPAGTEPQHFEPGKLPLLFEPNVGQAAEPARYLAHARGANFFFTPSEVVLSLKDEGRKTNDEGARDDGQQTMEDESLLSSFVFRPSSGSRPSSHVVLRFLGANPALAMEHGQAAPGKVNYLKGNDPSAWRTNVPLYGELTYNALYDGIDLTYSGDQGRLKGTYTVARGADPSTIRWRYEGANSPTMDEHGNLKISLKSEIRNPKSEITELAPLAWQEIGGERLAVAVSYDVHEDGSVGFALGAYDPAHLLIIDPTLTYSTYFGGNSSDSAYGLDVDATQNIYVTGSTGSTDYPLQSPIQPALASAPDIVITKLNPAGNTLIYSTYLGGNDIDWAKDIEVDAAGNVAVAGHTHSTNFPLMNARQTSLAGWIDAFILKLNTQGSALVFSTYLGGVNMDMAWGVAVDPAGNVYAAGETYSPNFPTFNAIQPTFGGGGTDAFIVKYTPDGLAYVYSTFLGGSSTTPSEVAFAIAADSTGNAYVTGDTLSQDFPVFNAMFPTYQGGESDAFITKLNANGSAFIYSTYFGGGMVGSGSGADTGFGIAADSAGNAYITGNTDSNDFPTQNPLHSTLTGFYDAFITKLNATGSQLVYSTYIGGNGAGNERGNAIAVNAAGEAAIVGLTDAAGFPVVNAIQPSHAGSFDAFAIKLTPAGNPASFVTYLGGSATDYGQGAAIDDAGNVYAAGFTASNNFPLANPYKDHLTTAFDIFISKIADDAGATPTATRTRTPTRTVTPTPTFGCAGGTRNVIIVDNSFLPQNITVTVGTTVSWLNEGPSQHTTTSDTGVWDSGILNPGQTFQFTIHTPGNYPYFCALHPGMVGSVTVQPTTCTPSPVSTSTATPVPNTPTSTLTRTPTRTATPIPTIGCAMATRYVIIVESGFLPQNITVTVGTTVNWLNEGPAQHTTTSDTGVWDSGTLNPGNIFQFTFNAAGTYPYHCALHPNMVGNVTVQPSTCTPTPAPTSTATPVPNTPIPTFTRTPTRTVTPTPTFGCAGGVRNVIIANNQFLPQVITITTGTTVNWLNEGPEQHTTTSDTGVWDSGTLNPGQTFQFAFHTPGTYPYHCAIHPGMVGSITVQQGACTPTPVSTATGTAPTATRTATATTPPAATSTRTPTLTPTPVSTAIPNTATSTPPIVSTSTSTPTTCAIQFTDVPPGHTFYTFVRCLACRGIISGYPCGGPGEPCDEDNTPYFRPNGSVTRGQIAKIVSEAAGFSEPPGAQQFEDVALGHTFFDWVWRLADRGIVSGYPCGGPGEPCGPGNLPYFRPNGNATRGQISKIVSEAAGFADPPGAQQFEDVLPGSTFFDFIYRLAARGIMNGYPCGGPGEPCGPGNLPYFRPASNATRGQLSKIAANTFFPECSPPRR